MVDVVDGTDDIDVDGADDDDPAAAKVDCVETTSNAGEVFFC